MCDGQSNCNFRTPALSNFRPMRIFSFMVPAIIHASWLAYPKDSNRSKEPFLISSSFSSRDKRVLKKFCQRSTDYLLPVFSSSVRSNMNIPLIFGSRISGFNFTFFHIQRDQWHQWVFQQESERLYFSVTIQVNLGTWQLNVWFYAHHVVWCLIWRPCSRDQD